VVDNPKFKEWFTIILLAITFLWAVVSLLITREALNEATTQSILVSSGTDTLLGALLSWNVLTIQYWFRKKPTETDDPVVRPVPPVPPAA
jgi:hypothetical protein